MKDFLKQLVPTKSAALVNKALADGNRVFLSDNGKGDYGCFCNPEGTLVCSFWPSSWYGYNIASQYVSEIPREEGQGFLLLEGCTNFEECDTSLLLRQNNRSATHRPKTLKEFLQQYQESSKLKEVFNNDTEITEH